MLMRTDPFRELDRLTQQFFGANGTTDRPAVMPMDAYRSDHEYVVQFDLPGVSADSIELDVERNVLTVQAQRSASFDDAAEVAECAKRDLGRRMFHKPLGGRQYPPEALQAWILAKLRLDAQAQIGPFEKAVVTVPAYFDEVRRKATQDAGYIAGLDVLDIINEPTAAAVAFGFQQGFLKPDGQAEKKKILVYDLGGGTFDVTVMEIGGKEFKALATDGDETLVAWMGPRSVFVTRLDREGRLLSPVPVRLFDHAGGTLQAVWIDGTWTLLLTAHQRGLTVIRLTRELEIVRDGKAAVPAVDDPRRQLLPAGEGQIEQRLPPGRPERRHIDAVDDRRMIGDLLL